jgi:hypothetical protein
MSGSAGHPGWITTDQFLDHSLGQLGERQTLVRLAVVDVFAEHGDGLSVGLGVEGVASFKKHQLEFLVYIPRQELLSTDQVRS